MYLMIASIDLQKLFSYIKFNLIKNLEKILIKINIFYLRIFIDESLEMHYETWKFCGKASAISNEIRSSHSIWGIRLENNYENQMAWTLKGCTFL